MANKVKTIEQPTHEDEKELDDILEATKSKVFVRGKEWAVSPLRNGTKRKITSIMLSDGKDDTVSCKCAAALRLNDYWGIKFLYWFLWRWFFYVRQYRDEELVEYISECKKKVGVEGYVIATTLLTGMKDTIMAMTREEVERFQAAQLSAQLGQSQKSTQTSAPLSTTSEVS